VPGASPFAKKRNSWFLLALAAILFAVLACETPVKRPKSGEEKGYGVTRGAFRGRWWNHFERGVSYADGRYWKEAEADLRDALGQRSEDQRRARTYGMHFVDYFPHRELGIVLFYEGRYEEAVRELETSLKQEKSARAEYYLDLTRRSLIQQDKADLRPPEIDLWAPLPGLFTNAFAVSVAGVARDDTYVKSVTVNGVPIRVDLAAPQVPFVMNVPLKPGENVVRVEATDLSEKRTVAERHLWADWQGPLLSIDEPEEGKALAGRGVRLRGYAYDDSGLQEILVNGQQILKEPAQEAALDYLIPAGGGLDTVVIQATDRVGNRTTAEIRLFGGHTYLQRFFLASLDSISLALLGNVSAEQDSIPPSIELKNCTGDQTTYLEQVYLEGVARDEGGVGFLAVNGQSVLRRAGKNVYFSYLAKLDAGGNVFTIEARDLAGNRTEKRVNFNRKLNRVHEVSSRLSVALLPLERKGVPGLAADAVEEALLTELVGGRRFQMVERRRLEEILREQKLGGSLLADPNAAIRIGKMLAANCILVGSVLEKEGSLEIYLRVVDTETSLILTAVDVYGEDLSQEMVRLLCRGLMIKLLDELPLVEGLVVTVRGNQGIVDLGREKHVKKGMRVIVFEEGEPVRHPLTGMVLGSDVVEMGRGLIQVVHEHMSDVELLGKEAPDRVKPMHKVITQ
jgi:TolB-like protein/tetratricopeptide (TPR) repeat protein